MKKIAIGVRDLPVRTKQPNQIDIEVGSRIRLQRHLKGISQVAFGEAVGVTLQKIKKYEKGTNRVSASRLSDVARMGVSQTLLEAAITQPRPVFSCFVNLLQSEEARKQIILVIDGPAA